jgi:hypothetical protein
LSERQIWNARVVFGIGDNERISLLLAALRQRGEPGVDLSGNGVYRDQQASEPQNIRFENPCMHDRIPLIDQTQTAAIKTADFMVGTTLRTFSRRNATVLRRTTGRASGAAGSRAWRSQFEDRGGE